MDEKAIISFAVWIVVGQVILALGLYVEWRRRHPRPTRQQDKRHPPMTGPDESAGSE